MEGYLSCGRFTLRNMKPRPQNRLPSPERQRQEQAPTHHLAVKGSKVSVCQGEAELVGVKATHLNGHLVGWSS